MGQNEMHRRKQYRRENELLPQGAEWLSRPLNTLMDLFERPLGRLERPLAELWGTVSPAVDVAENDKEVQVRAEIPGLCEKDLNLSYSQGVLTIEGHKREEESRRRGSFRYRESHYGSFRRDIPIGEDFEWDAARASYRDGVLNVAIPKKTGKGHEGKPIKIQ
jgi:HSP20 family protein